jgi:hypothetical protein
MENAPLPSNSRYGRLGNSSSVTFMNRIPAIIACFLMSALFIGCDFRKVVVNDPIRPKDVAFIKSGKTTMQEVVIRLGAPDEILGTSDRLWFQYHFKTTKFLRIDFGVLLRLWSPVTPPLSIGRSNAGTDVFLIAFDPKWVTQDLSFPPPSETDKIGFWPF